MALPEANEKLSHGEPTWFAGKGKVFAMLDDHHHGAAHLSVWLPQPFGAQEALVGSDPGRFFRPPYVGVSGWVGMVLDDGPDWREVARLVREAYLHVATPKLRNLVTTRDNPQEDDVATKSARTPKSAMSRDEREERIDAGFAKVAEAFAGDRQVTTGKMMSSIGLKVNGRIFAMMVRGSFVAKLPRDRVDELVQSGLGERFDPRRDGRVMKEWVVMRGTKPSWVELAEEARRFVASAPRAARTNRGRSSQPAAQPRSSRASRRT